MNKILTYFLCYKFLLKSLSNDINNLKAMEYLEKEERTNSKEARKSVRKF